MTDLSIVTTLYRSAPYVDEFYRRAQAAAEQLTRDFQMVFVNDGSPDESLELAVALHRRDPRVEVVDLSRNFGHMRAVMTGLSYACGELTFLVDSDLEETPELLLPLHEAMQATGADLVYGVQAARSRGPIERLGGAFFFWFFNLVSPTPIPRNVVMARLMTERFRRSLLEHREREVATIAGLCAVTGYAQAAVVVEKGWRRATTYSFTARVRAFVDAVTSFSAAPLVFIFYVGLVIMLLSTAAATYLVIRKLVFGSLLAGWPSLIVSVWFLGGLTIFCLGIIGIYLSRVFVEVKRRPRTIVRHVYRQGEA